MSSNVEQRSKVLVVEDEAETRENLQRWLTLSGYAVIAAANGTEAIALLKRHPVDVVLTDLQMPGLHGIDLLVLIKELDPTIEVIILTGSATLENAIEAVRARAFDFLQKPLSDLSRLNLVIEKALLQRQPSPPSAVAAQPGESQPPMAEGLTPREREVLSLLATGSENKDIARKLCLSEKTVRNLLSAIYAKLGVENRTQAVIFSQQQGWV